MEDLLCKRITDYNFAKSNNVRMGASSEGLNLSKSSDWKAFIVIAHLEFLESNDVAGAIGPSSRDMAIRALLDWI